MVVVAIENDMDADAGALVQGLEHIRPFHHVTGGDVLAGGDDVLSTIQCLQAMGVSIKPAGQAGTYKVTGQGPQLTEPVDILNAGNSGTSMRLISGILASQSFVSVITGDDSLRTRPMHRIVDPLEQMGAQIMGRQDNTLAPLIFRGGKLQGIEYNLPMASAQVKSAIMLAGLCASSQHQTYSLRRWLPVVARKLDHQLGAGVRLQSELELRRDPG